MVWDSAGDPTPATLMAYLVTWLGASGASLLVALWGFADALLDGRAVRRLRPPGPGRRRLSGQAWVNLFLAGTFVLEASVWVALGALVVLGPAHISLSGWGSVVVVLPPLLVTARVVALRVNRAMQARLRAEQKAIV